MDKQITFEEIKEIIELIRGMDKISDFTLKYGDVEISLSRGGNQKSSASTDAPAPARQPPAKSEPVMPLETAPVAAETHVEAETEPREGEVVIKSPMVGTFYRCPKPGEPPFVEAGQAVREDTVLCIIEVMKLMSSIEAKVTGVLTRILVEDAQPVEHGQPLMIIKMDEG